MSFDPTLLIGITLVSTVVLLIGYFTDKIVYISPSKIFGFLITLIFVTISTILLLLIISSIWLLYTTTL